MLASPHTKCSIGFGELQSLFKRLDHDIKWRSTASQHVFPGVKELFATLTNDLVREDFLEKITGKQQLGVKWLSLKTLLEGVKFLSAEVLPYLVFTTFITLELLELFVKLHVEVCQSINPVYYTACSSHRLCVGLCKLLLYKLNVVLLYCLVWCMSTVSG